MQSSEYIKSLNSVFSDHFSDALGSFLINTNTEIPYFMYEANAVFYNYLLVGITVERRQIFLSVLESGMAISLFNAFLPETDPLDLARELETHLKLRIPDKYLAANGWL